MHIRQELQLSKELQNHAQIGNYRVFPTINHVAQKRGKCNFQQPCCNPEPECTGKEKHLKSRTCLR